MRYGPEPKLIGLNDGWPFSDGPMEWDCHVESRFNEARHDPPEEIHLVCDRCPQSIFCLMPDTYQRGFTWNLSLLKARIADHVLKCHPEAVES